MADRGSTITVPLAHMDALRDRLICEIATKGEALERLWAGGDRAGVRQTLDELDVLRDMTSSVGWENSELSDEFIEDGCYPIGPLYDREVEPWRRVFEFAAEWTVSELQDSGGEPAELRSFADRLDWLRGAIAVLSPAVLDEVPA